MRECCDNCRFAIHEMEMPKNCNYFRFSYDRLCHAAMQSFAGRTLEENGRLKDCPLVEVKEEHKEQK